jgi:hypothetical protein
MVKSRKASNLWIFTARLFAIFYALYSLHSFDFILCGEAAKISNGEETVEGVKKL